MMVDEWVYCNGWENIEIGDDSFVITSIDNFCEIKEKMYDHIDIVSMRRQKNKTNSSRSPNK
jgi:hypothetical protein